MSVQSIPVLSLDCRLWERLGMPVFFTIVCAKHLILPWDMVTLQQQRCHERGEITYITSP